jgi:hypothetical protein
VSMPPRPPKSAAALVAAFALASPAQSDGRRGSYLAPAGYCTGASVEVMICLHITRGMRLGYRCFARRFV